MMQIRVTWAKLLLFQSLQHLSETTIKSCPDSTVVVAMVVVVVVVVVVHLASSNDRLTLPARTVRYPMTVELIRALGRGWV